jgi:hypothetical protein
MNLLTQQNCRQFDILSAWDELNCGKLCYKKPLRKPIHSNLWDRLPDPKPESQWYDKKVHITLCNKD